MDRRAVQTVVCDLIHLLIVMNDTAACSTEGEGRSDDCRITDYVLYKIVCVFISCNDL